MNYGAARAHALALAALLLSSSALAQVAIGTMGHSLTDEYQRPQSTRQFGLDGFNWLEILSRTRGTQVTFGPYDATLDSFGESGGYAYNHAIGGAMVLNSNLPQQLADLTADVAAHRVDAVVIWIGSLDFSVRSMRGESFDLNDASFLAFQSDFVGTLVNALDTLIAAGATDIALAKIDFASNRNDIMLATNDTNDLLAAAVAARPQVAMFDALSELKARYDAGAGVVRIASFTALGTAAPSSDLVDPPGGVTPAQCGFNNQTKAPGCPTAAYQGHVLQDDGAHLTTPMQGLVANAVVGALQARGFAVSPLTDADILSISGVAASPPSSGLELRWLSLTTKCKASTSVCRIKGNLVARNAGTIASNAASLSFLLSTDPAADAGDRVVGAGSVPSLAAGKQKKVKLNATLPTGVSTAGSYVIVQPSVGSAMVQGPLN